MHYRKNLLLPLIMSVVISADAASTSLSLDSCRTLALANNKELRAAEMERRAAHYGRKSAFTAYLPKVSASGIYMHTDRELSLLSDEQKSGLSQSSDIIQTFLVLKGHYARHQGLRKIP